MGNRIDYIRIAAIQFPFIPVIVHLGYNTLSEPDGYLNSRIIGNYDQKINTNVSTLASLLKSNNINTEILKNLQSDYIDWLILTVEGILEFICIKEKPHIILFPEYSLPLESSHELKEILIKYSERRCIIGGIGSVSINGAQKRNRFVIINDGEISYGEKMVLTDEEKARRIEEGEGPLLYVLKLYLNDKKQNFPVLITMCSDSIDLLTPPSRVSNKANQECEEKGIEYNKVDSILIPAFTTKTVDMQGTGEAVRKWRIVALANCSFWGGTQMWFPPHPIKGLEDDASPPIKKLDSACIVAEIPYNPIPEIQPKSKPIGIGSGNILKPQFGCRTYNIRFKNEERAEDNNSIGLDTESFLTLINDRLYKAIAYAGIIRIGNSLDNEKNNHIIATMNAWKELEEKIVSLIPSRPIRTYENLPRDIIPYLDKIIFGDPYITVVDAIQDLTPNEEYKGYLKEIKSYLNSKDLLPLYMWLNMKKGNDENGK
jgi:hypothetical protein